MLKNIIKKENYMIEQDYIMRLIHEVIRTLLKILLNIDSESQDELSTENNKMERKHGELLELVDAGKINEAENRLLDELDTDDLQDFKSALMFYEYLNEKDTCFLENNNFTKNEVIDGIRYVSNLYGYSSMIEVLLSIIPE